MYFHDISGMNIEKHKALNATIESLVQNKSQISVQAVVKFLGPLIRACHFIFSAYCSCVNVYSTTATWCQPNCSK